MKTKQLKQFWLATALTSVTIIAEGAIAAAAAQDDTIVVTATRRAQNIQDVPIAVTAVSGQQLQRAGVDDLNTLSRVAPSFNIEGAQTSATTFTFRIRGIGTTGQNVGFESSVGVFLDGVYLSRPGVALGDLIDIEQFEVLRGPQGTLFGRNTSAGALNITTKKPVLNEVEGFGSFTYGNFNTAKAQGAINIPLLDDVAAFRLSGGYHGRDGTFTSTGGTESHDRDRFTLRGQLYAEPNDRMNLRLIGDYSKSDETCCDAVIINETLLAAPQPSLGGASLYDLVGLIPDGVDRFGQDAIDNRITSSEPFQDDIEQWGVSAELNLDLGFADLTYIPAYRDFATTVTSFPDFVGIDVYAVQAPDGGPGQFVSYETMTHELRLQGEMFGGRLDWLLGGYYLNEDISFQSIFTLGDAFQQNTSAFLLAVDPTLPTTLASNPLVMANPALALNPALVFAGGVSADGDYASNLFTQDTESFAFFTHNILHLSDRLDLTIGLRYTDEEKTGGFQQLDAGGASCLATLSTAAGGGIPANVLPLAVGFGCFPFAAPADLPGAGLPPAPPAFPGVPTPATFQAAFSDDALIYTFNAAYKVTDDVNAYASYTRGYKSGGINLDPTATIFGGDPLFESEIAKAYEIGLKTTLFDGRLRANIAGFYTSIDNLQVLQFTGVQFQTFNVPKAITSGVEVEANLAVTRDLTLNSAITYANARYPDDCDQGATPAAQAAGVSILCGNNLTAAPEFVGNFGATYERSFGKHRAFLTGNARVESEQRTRTFPDPFDIDPGNTKIDLRAGFGADDGLWTIEGWVQNLTDKETRNVTFSVPLRGAGPVGATGAYYEEPRTYGVTIRSRF